MPAGHQSQFQITTVILISGLLRRITYPISTTFVSNPILDADPAQRCKLSKAVTGHVRIACKQTIQHLAHLHSHYLEDVVAPRTTPKSTTRTTLLALMLMKIAGVTPDVSRHPCIARQCNRIRRTNNVERRSHPTVYHRCCLLILAVELYH